MSATEEPDWPLKYPWRLLPRGGRHPFVPGGMEWLKNPRRGDVAKGYVDADENEWIPARLTRPEDFHWDVQHRDGTHTNIAPNGEIHHGPDNF